jgi:hypothetical protein
MPQSNRRKDATGRSTVSFAVAAKSVALAKMSKTGATTVSSSSSSGGSGKSKARPSFKSKKKPQTITDDADPAAEKKKKKKGGRRNRNTAKGSFYRNQNAPVISWYAVKEALKKHLRYGFEKYPTGKLIGIVDGLNDVCLALYGKNDSERKTMLESIAKKGLAAPSGFEEFATVDGAQISECAVDKTSLFVGKKIERCLEAASVCSLQRKAQTTTVLDFCQGVKNCEKRVYGDRSGINATNEG